MMKENTCQDCAQFKQHYGISDDRYHWVNCGYCRAYRRPKHRHALAQICERFVPCERKPTVPRDKLMLTVERLRHILDMEFPPEMPMEE